jgi:DNA-binding transcriptional ArsR family regulator
MRKLSDGATPDLDAVFHALADPTRRAIVERLAQGEATVGTVAAPHDMAMPSISKHVKVLERAGLISRRVAGREHWLRLQPEGFRSPTEWFAHYQQFWTGSVDRLERLLTELEEQKGPEQ